MKLLGVTNDRTLVFMIISSLYVNRIESTLDCLVKFLSLEQRGTLMKAFIESKFAYCPWVSLHT